MKKGVNNTSLGDYVRARRQSRNMDIRTAAEHSGFHESYWRKLEAGHYERPDANNLRVIAETLSWPLEDLYSLCGYTITKDLPSFGPYLRATTNMSPKDIKVMERIFHSLADDDQPDENDRRVA